ncbi:hypothetical protein SAMN02787073_1537 [Chryseobacterium vrystaatense]|uniref:Uncharacterized protein n=1 Tax=Chryseobacterium vrystaatense TaxID=307480 RepID=A0A1M4ZAN8_9FLAO|nr:hypothetical protein [Chryseobacterium vrystaatense]KFF27290.1 hypothetical protein IW16_08585 [Chryseobacterium vrystaatense]SHF15129.1 hypothetical protein SAMN02787073_1537 [Chryseobacterium vrystaatense]
MKKIFLYILAGSLCFSACKKDDEVETYKEPEDIAVQNSYDDQAIKKFMNDNYLDAQGNIKTFSTTDTSDDNEKKLSDLPYETLPSGTIYIMREGAQPTENPQTIETNDILTLMVKANAHLATNTDGNVAFISTLKMVNTINDNAIPMIDPAFFYVKKAFLTNGLTRSYYEIEGFQEAIKKFKAFDNIPSGSPYNLQGVILVPSRAAFARDPHYPYIGNNSLRNYSFSFNFQVYGRKARPTDQE